MEMDFVDPSRTQEFQTILTTIRQFVDKEIIPLEKEYVSYNFNKLQPILEKKR